MNAGCSFGMLVQPKSTPPPQKNLVSQKKNRKKIFCLRIRIGDTNRFRGSLSNTFFWPISKKFSLSEKYFFERKICCLRIRIGDTNRFRGSLSNTFFDQTQKKLVSKLSEAPWTRALKDHWPAYSWQVVCTKIMKSNFSKSILKSIFKHSRGYTMFLEHKYSFSEKKLKIISGKNIFSSFWVIWARVV